MEIIKNTLQMNHNMGILKFEDEYYLITVFYVGDFEKEQKNFIDPTYLSASIKEKKNVPHLDIYFKEKEVIINLDIFSYVKEDEIDKMIEQFKLAKKEIQEIKKILEEYIYPYY